MSLFRKEAISHQNERLTGAITLAQPISIKLTVLILVSVAITIITFLFSAEYSRKETVRGFLMPNKGVIKSYANQGGTIEKLWVKEGDKVVKGQSLATIIVQQNNSNGIDLSTQLAEQLNAQENLLIDEISQRQGIWQNRYAEVINSEIRLGRLNISFDSFNKLLFGLENVLVIYFAAIMVMANSLSVGMVLAFIAYKGQLTDRFANLIEQVIQFKMMRLHLDRIADIALTEQEANREGEATFTDELKGQLSLENICFSYNEDQTPTLNNVNLSLNSGESIAITGPSGAGKTTLMKIMLGLLQPSSGKVYLDGKDINNVGLKNYRKKIAAVMQGDTLLAGSIADNICFFDPQPSYLKIEQCAHLAAIHDDINKMTMGYNSLVGDMGANLSGGQKQRLLLARALYQSPCVLFMDEATSHLDKGNETKISEQIQHLPMTRIMIAHRQETINMAEKVYVLKDGVLINLNEGPSEAVN